MNKPVALITGGAGGIGQACVELLSDRYRIAVIDADGQAVEASRPDDGLGIGCDVSDEGSVSGCVEQVEARLGPISALVTLAGVIQSRHFTPAEFEQADWDRVMDVNVRGTWLFCRNVGSRMAARGAGAIVTVSSVAGHRSWPTHAYGPSKAAVMAMTRNLAVEWGRSGVRVNSVSPGFTRTRRMDELERLRGATNSAHIEQTALGRWIRADEVAAAIAFLLSDAASAITGIDLPVDAGWLSAINWSGFGASRPLSARTPA